MYERGLHSSSTMSKRTFSIKSCCVLLHLLTFNSINYETE
nr:MAG TPA: hypothetical protein [Caudoviricetes sp.]